MYQPEPAEPFQRTFDDESAAAAVIERLGSAGISSDASVLHVGDPSSHSSAAGGAARREGPRARVVGRRVAMGAIAGVLIGAAVGAAFIATTTAGVPLLSAMAGAAGVCGATAGALVGGAPAGGREDVRAEPGAARRIVVRAHPADPVQERIAMEMFAQPDPPRSRGVPGEGVEPPQRPEPPEGGPGEYDSDA